MVDRYTRIVLTVIAACLVYLCLVLTPLGTPLRAQQPGAPAQGAARPGLATGPAEVVIVGWRTDSDAALPVSVRNTVTTQAAAENTTRVVVAGWEDARRGAVRISADAGVPVDLTAAPRPLRVVLAGSEQTPGAWRQRVPVDTK
jgi:hypothetical protein